MDKLMQAAEPSAEEKTKANINRRKKAADAEIHDTAPKERKIKVDDKYKCHYYKKSNCVIFPCFASPEARIAKSCWAHRGGQYLRYLGPNWEVAPSQKLKSKNRKRKVVESSEEDFEGDTKAADSEAEL